MLLWLFQVNLCKKNSKVFFLCDTYMYFYNCCITYYPGHGVLLVCSTFIVDISVAISCFLFLNVVFVACLVDMSCKSLCLILVPQCLCGSNIM